VRADARAPALLASAPDALVRADARAPALLACALLALVRADARAPALLASAPDALVRADARAPALLALAPLALVQADAALACRTFCCRSRCCPGPAVADPFGRGIPRVCAVCRSLSFFFLHRRHRRVRRRHGRVLRHHRRVRRRRRISTTLVRYRHAVHAVEVDYSLVCTEIDAQERCVVL
jgi:hypothetical protein